MSAQPIVIDPLELQSAPRQATPVAMPSGAASASPITIDPLDLDKPEQPASPQSQQPQPKQAGPTMRAYQPSFAERFFAPVREGAIGHSVSETMPKLAQALPSLFEPQETDANPEEQTHAGEALAFGAGNNQPGAMKGVEEFAGGMTTAPNLLLMAGGPATRLLEPLVGKIGVGVVNKLIQAGFSAQMLTQAAKQSPELVDAVKKGDYKQAEQIATEMGLGMAFATHMGKELGAPEPVDVGATLDRAKAAAPEAIQPEQRPGLPAGPAARALPAAPEQRPAIPMPKQTPTVIPPSGETIQAPGQPQAALPAGKTAPQLPPGPRAPREAIGEGLQSNVGPGEKPIPLPARTPKTIPPSEKPIAVGPTTIDPLELKKTAKVSTKPAATPLSATKPAAPVAELTPAQQAFELKGQIRQLENRNSELRYSSLKTRTYESATKNTAQQRSISAKLSDLRAQLEKIEPRPEAKPFAYPENERIAPRTSATKLPVAERPATKPEAAAPEPKQSKTPTYDRLPPEMREVVDSLATAHSHLPQILREANEADMRKLSESGTPRKEQYARLVAKDAGIEPEPKKEGPSAVDFLSALGGKEKPEARPLSAKPEAGISPEAIAKMNEPVSDRAKLEGLDADTKAVQDRLSAGQGSPDERRAAERRITENDQMVRELGERRQADRRGEPTEPHPAELRGTLPGMETAVREQKAAAGQEQGEELTKEIARPLSNIDERAGNMERESPLFRDSEASGQTGLFAKAAEPKTSAGERESLLGKGSTLHAGIDPTMVSDVYHRIEKAYQEHVADPMIEKMGMGRTHKDVEAVDPKLASRIRRYEAAPQYFRTKAEDIAKRVTDGLTRAQERLFSLMADQQSRENLQKNHPAEYAQALADKGVQTALARYKAHGEALTKAHAILGGEVMPGDHLPWIYPEHVSGIGQRVAESDAGGRGFDRGITPQRADQFGRTTTAEYHYKNGLHEFGPAFARKYSRTMTKLAEHATAQEFLSKSTKIEPGDRLPPVITYNGKTFYSPEIVKMIRDAKPGKASEALADSLGVKTLPKPKDAEAYAQYRPTGGKEAPVYLGPGAAVKTLKGLADSDPGRMDPVGRFLQEQVIGMGFGVRHGFNLFRRITQTFPLGTSSPVNWIRAVRVITDHGLRERALARTNDPAYDALLRWSAISPEGVGSWKAYQGGNLNPANWLRTFAKVGNRWLFEPGGVDQKARIWMRDLLKSQRPDISDEKAAQLIRDQLGNYSRENWTKNQKLLSHVLLFPGWDFSSINWVIRHPVKTAVPPAILIMLVNQAIHRSGGKQEPGDEFDPFAIHAGGHAYGTPGLEEPLARAALKPFGRAVQARLEGQTGRQAVAEGARAVPQALAGIAGMTRPDLALPFEVAAGKTRFGRDIVAPGDFTRRGTVLPNKGAEDIGTHALRTFFPPLQRVTEENQSLSDAALSNFGLNRYQEQARRPQPSERQQDYRNVKDDIRSLEQQARTIADDRSLSPEEKQQKLAPVRAQYRELIRRDRPR